MTDNSLPHLSKRLAVIAFDCISVLCIAILCSLSLAKPAYAYVDPSVMTYTIQAVAGVAVALGAVAGVAFRRSRKTLFRLLNIDENAGKIVEQSIQRIDAADKNAHKQADERAKELTSIKQDTSRNKPISWKKRLIYSAIASLGLVFTVFVATPFELIGGATGSLLYSLAETWQLFALTGLAMWLIFTLLLSALKGKAFNVAITAVATLAVLCYLQALFGNTHLPAANGAAVDWYNHTKDTVINGFSWCLGIALVIMIFWKRPTLCRNILCCLSVCIVIVEGIGVASLFADSASTNKTINGSGSYITEDGLYDVSDTSNVIVFVLDTFDVSVLDEITQDKPSVLDEMTGFTYYKDVSGTFAPTRYAMPWILTAEYIQADESYSHYLDTIYDRASFLDDLSATNYSIGIYTDTFGATDNEHLAGFDYVSQHAMNIHSIQSVDLNEAATLAIMYKASLYRDLPWIAKRHFWFYTDEINEAMAQTSDTQTDPANTLYVMNDARYYEKLQQTKLSINADQVGSFRLIHLVGAHYPYTIDENGMQTSNGDAISEQQQCQGVLKIVSEYLKQLKMLGVYDNSTIIITADHGHWVWESEPLACAENPIMLIKPAHQKAESEHPIVYSFAPVSQLDLHASIMKAITGNGAKYGYALDEIPADGKRERCYLHVTHDGINDWEFIEYSIDGYSLDFANWKETGQVWDCTK